MLKAEEIEGRARARLAPCGFAVLGWFRAEDGRPGLLIGNIGSSLWDAFSAWHASHPGPDPLNRWTVEQMAGAAAELDARARYPFGDTVWPFQRYAMDATGMQPSPLGMLIHPQYGLWIAFRAAFIFDTQFDIAAPRTHPHPCARCADKPCLFSCPVDAFNRDGYDVGRCRHFLETSSGSDCTNHGCQARRACPVGRSYAYDDEQQAFHMAAFGSV